MRPPMVILAGGRGTRLGDLTKNSPKPMIEIFGKPFLHLLIDNYRSQGFKEFTISTGYLAEQIESYDFGPNVRFIRDEADEGKLEALRNVLKTIPDRSTWVVNGDTFITTPLPRRLLARTVLIHNGVDAGAQYLSKWSGLIDLVNSGKFYDIGTPKGLEDFRNYYENLSE